jgi:adenylate cyclase
MVTIWSIPAPTALSSSSGRQEVMVRRHELQLDGKGRISFGNSGNDPLVDIADFEHL